MKPIKTVIQHTAKNFKKYTNAIISIKKTLKKYNNPKIWRDNDSSNNKHNEI